MYQTKLIHRYPTTSLGRTTVRAAAAPKLAPPKRPATAPAKVDNLKKGTDPLLRAGDLCVMCAPNTTEGLRLLRDESRDLAFMLAKPHGKGAFGTVSYAQTQRGSRLLAKELYTQPSGEQMAANVRVSKLPKVVHEIEIHREVPSAIDSVAAVATNDRVVHLMPLFDGDLSQATAASHQPSFTAADRQTLALEVFAQTTSSLTDFHKRLYVHGDIKLDNILWSRQGDFKLADYGVTRHLDVSSMTLSGKRGTPYTMAPEIFNGEHYGCPADMWALGVTLGEMFVADPHFAFGPGNPFRHIQQPPQWALPLMLFQVLDEEGKLDPSKLQHGRSDMHRFFQAWWAKSPQTCRFAIEELFDLNPDHRATADYAHTVAQGLIAQRPGHADAVQGLLRKLPVADGKRAARFDELTQAWRSWQRVQDVVANHMRLAAPLIARVQAAA